MRQICHEHCPPGRHRPRGGTILAIAALLVLGLFLHSLVLLLLYVVLGLAVGTFVAGLVFLYFNVLRGDPHDIEDGQRTKIGPPPSMPVPPPPRWLSAGKISRADLGQRTECAAKLERSDLIPHDRNEADQNAEDHGQALHLGICPGPERPGTAEGDQQA